MRKYTAQFLFVILALWLPCVARGQDATIKSYWEAILRSGQTPTADQMAQARALLGAAISDEIPVAIPAGFSFTPPFSIYRSGGGKFRTSFKPRDYFVSGTHYWVDPVNGNSGNSGLAANLPKQGISNTITTAENSGGTSFVYHLKAGVYSATSSLNFSANPPWANFSMICEDGIANIICGQTGASWVAEASPNQLVYKTTVTNPTGAFDFAWLDEYGDPRPLLPKASIAAVQASAGSVYVSGSDVYIRLFDDRVPDTSLYWLNSAQGHRTYNHADTGPTPPATQNVYLENIRFIGGTTSAFLVDNVSGNFTAHNCSFTASGGNGGLLVRRDKPSITITSACRAVHNGVGDGFNYHNYVGVPADTVEIDPRGRYNGRNSGSTNNGSTMHEGGAIITIGGEFVRNGNKNIHDIEDGTQRWCLGTMCASVKDTTFLDSVDYYTGGSLTSNVKMWLDECTVDTNLGPASRTALRVGLGSTVYLRRTRLSGLIDNLGTIVEY